MVDNKKIEEAAQLHRFEIIASMHGSTLGTPMQCFKEEVDTETELIENSFITGAKWAIKELLKNLWHPISEEPVKDKPFLTQQKDKWLVDVDSSKFLDNNWNRHCEIQGIKRWLYVEDLLPKTKTQKGDEQ